MINNTQQLLEILVGTVAPTILGLVASLVQLARNGWKGLRQFFASMVMCVFTGNLAFWLLDLTDFPPTVDAAIISISAYSGGFLLDAILWRVNKEIRTAKIPGIESQTDPAE